MKTYFNSQINRHEIDTGEGIITLSYHYGRIYVNSRSYNDIDFIQIALMETNYPLIPAAFDLYHRDKEAGIIAADYKFQ